MNTDCPFCQDHTEDIDYLFMRCDFVQQIWHTIVEYTPNPIKANLSFPDWIDHVWKNGKVYGVIYGNLL